MGVAMAVKQHIPRKTASEWGERLWTSEARGSLAGALFWLFDCDVTPDRPSTYEKWIDHDRDMNL